MEDPVQDDLTAFEVHLCEGKRGIGSNGDVSGPAGSPNRNIAVACDGDAAAVGGVHHGAADIDSSGVIEDDVRPLHVAAGGNSIAPVVRITQFIGIAFRRTSVASPFRNHAGGMGADA